MGRIFCLPRRTFVLLFCSVMAVIFWLDIVVLGAIGIINMGHIEPSHCSGNECMDMLSCQGTKESSWHVHEVFTVFGGAVFSTIGFMGALNHHPRELYLFANFLYFLVGLNVVLTLWDWMYVQTCGAYPYQVIDSTLDIPSFVSPIPTWQKLTIKKFDNFPVQRINDFTHTNVWKWYVRSLILSSCLLLYIGHGIYILAIDLDVGELGLGENFSVKAWRDARIQEAELYHTVKNNTCLEDVLYAFCPCLGRQIFPESDDAEKIEEFLPIGTLPLDGPFKERSYGVAERAAQRDTVTKVIL